MQDPSSAAAFQPIRPHFPEQEQHLKCPRCDSTNTKFCYYNNYNLSQPRHFCKSCRRYWTKGGALRNIPVGGGTRKNSKRSSTDDSNGPSSTNPSKRSTPSTNIKAEYTALGQSAPLQLPKVESLGQSSLQEGQMSQMIDAGGSFSSLLSTNNHNYVSFMESFHHGVGGHGVLSIPSSGLNSVGSATPTSAPPENFWASSGGSGEEGPGNAGGGGGWPDLSIYTPCSRFP